MTTNEITNEITALLDEWGIDYTATSSSIHHGGVTLSIASNKGTPDVEITDGGTLVAITSSAAKAAALLAFPFARRVWDAGYCGDFEIDVLDDFLDMQLSYWGNSVTLSGDVKASSEFTVAEHPLFRKQVTMSDLSAVLESVELAYGNPDEAWQALCGASDFDGDRWEDIIEFLDEDVHITRGARFAKVESYRNECIALVEDWDNESPARVIDIEAVDDVVRWAMGDIAAAVLYAIS